MRKKVIAGNWKMFKDLGESVTLISEIKNELNSLPESVEAIVCPPFTSLETASTLLKGSAIILGAQNMHFESSGAFTGEIAPQMLKSVGCEFVILGHSERRTLFFETDSTINKKIKSALANNLKPIFCLGETREEREQGITFDVVDRQLVKGLDGISETDLEKIIIAYEPVWAIGTGLTATPAQAQEVHEFIRSLIAKIYSASAAEKIIIQYGGSVKPENARELLTQKDIDGALVGGACLKADSFAKIVKSVL
ncbi:MAG: triose-phosphate isomerase [bacterium]